jgi:hypothetical protein
MSFGPYQTFVEHGKPGPYTGEELGVMWLKHTAHLCGSKLKNYDLILLLPKGTKVPEEAEAWRTVTRFDENSKIEAWPMGPNAVFQQVQWFYYHNKLTGPFFWCEPDCVPVVPDWLDLIRKEYEEANKPFMGALVEAISKNGTRVPRHITGNAVYPDKAYKLAPKLMEARNTPWDVWAAEAILKQCHFTNLIQHEYRHEEIKSRRELSQILRPDTALFHTDKFGAIYRFLGGGQVAGPEPHQRDEISSTAITREQIGKPLVEVLTEPPPPPDLDTMLDMIRMRSELDKNDRRKIAYFMLEHNLVNSGHFGTHLKRKKHLENAEQPADIPA